jgi:hypothetical protein
MTSDDKFWLSLWGAAFATIVVLTTIGVLHNVHRIETLSKAVDPVGLTCADDVNSHYALPMCQLYFQSKKGQ